MPFLYPLALTMASYSSTWAPHLGAEAVQKGQEDNVLGTSWVVLPADATTLRHTLYQEATNYSSPAKSSLPFAVINKVLLENSHAHLFTRGTCYMWLPSLNKGRVVQPTICPAKPKIFQTSLLTPALYHPKWSQAGHLLAHWHTCPLSLSHFLTGAFWDHVLNLLLRS